MSFDRRRRDASVRSSRMGGFGFVASARVMPTGRSAKDSHSPFATFCQDSDECVLRAVKRSPRSQWNDGLRPYSSPSRGDPCTRAIRPFETIVVCSMMVRPRP